MVDPVECGFQIGVKNPLPLRVLPGESQVDHLDRVMTSATRPEPVLLGVQPGLPLRFQRVADPLLLSPVSDHGNTEWAFTAFLGYPYPPHRQRVSGSAVTMQQHRQVGPVSGGQRDPPVDAWGVAARVALGHPAHADQRVGPAAQHEFLQIADLFEVRGLCRLEDPLP